VLLTLVLAVKTLLGQNHLSKNLNLVTLPAGTERRKQIIFMKIDKQPRQGCKATTAVTHNIILLKTSNISL
jgi:hypothetical protein